MKATFLIKSRFWFEQNAYQDFSGDWCQSRGTYEEADLSLYVVSDSDVGQIVKATAKSMKHYKWAIQKRLYKSKDPEYFL